MKQIILSMAVLFTVAGMQAMRQPTNTGLMGAMPPVTYNPAASTRPAQMPMDAMPMDAMPRVNTGLRDVRVTKPAMVPMNMQRSTVTRNMY